MRPALVSITCCLVLAAALGPAAAPALAGEAPSVEHARALWSKSPHGRMLERILPPAVEPKDLPEPGSEGARLTARYCVQCHHLPSPQMHAAGQWRGIVERMVWRMRGNGNLGAVMKGLMEQVEAPTDEEASTLVRYLEKHGQRPMDPSDPALRTQAGRAYHIACTQCHALPDPQRHTAAEWPQVVERMKVHMQWANTVVGPDELKTTPTLDTAQIVRFLQQRARRD